MNALPTVAVAALLTLMVAMPAPAAKTSDASGVTRGRALFASVGCYECHGYAGQGGAAGPRIAATEMPYAAFAAYLRHPRREMPPYTAAVLSDADVSAIYAYVRTLPAISRTSPSPSALP